MDVRSQGSVYQQNLHRFHDVDYKGVASKLKQGGDAGAYKNSIDVNQKSGLYKQNAAKFYGDDFAETYKNFSIYLYIGPHKGAFSKGMQPISLETSHPAMVKGLTEFKR